MISGIVLAAGSSERMGRQKLLLDFQGKPVLQRVLEAAVGSNLDEVICVARNPGEMRDSVPFDHAKLRWAPNKRAFRGQSTSIIAGLKAISPESEGALFMVGDQPLLKPELLNGLIRLFKSGASLIVAPRFRGQTRNPVLFRKDLFAAILRLKGDQGGRGLIAKHREESAFLDWTDESPFLDLDTWEDYKKLETRGRIAR